MIKATHLRITVAVLCVAVANAGDAQRNSDAQRAQTEGFVVVRFASNGGHIYELLRVEELETGKGGGLRNPAVQALELANRGLSSAVHTGWLPAGEYRLKRFETAGSTYTASGRLSLEELFPPFQVEAGVITDLGTLIEQPVGGAISTVVQWNGPDAYNDELYEGLRSAAGGLAGSPIRWDGTIGWKYQETIATHSAPGGLISAIAEHVVRGPNELMLKEQWSQTASPAELVTLIKQATIALTRPAFDADDNAYFGSNLGQVLRRSKNGMWTNLDTRTLDEIGGVVVDGARLYASTVHGVLLTSTDAGAAWTVSPTRLPGRVTSMARLPSGDLLVATAGTADLDAAIFRGPDLQTLSAEPWKRLEIGSRVKRFRNRRAMLAVSGERLIAWVHYNKSFVYDTRVDTWADTKTDADLGELLVNDAAGLVYSAGPFKNALLTADDGRTWKTTRFSETPVAVGFRDASNGIAVVVEGGVMVSGEYFAETTADGGATWTRVGAPPSGCMFGRYLPPTDEMVCMGRDGGIQTTKNGVDWTIERVVY